MQARQVRLLPLPPYYQLNYLVVASSWQGDHRVHSKIFDATGLSDVIVAPAFAQHPDAETQQNNTEST